MKNDVNPVTAREIFETLRKCFAAWLTRADRMGFDSDAFRRADESLRYDGESSSESKSASK